MLKGNFPTDKFKGLRTPFYYYDTALLRRTLDILKGIMEKNPSFRIHYAIKANANPQILKIISSYGFGADCVSGGEIKAAVAAGFMPPNIVFAGVGKSDEEINLGLELGIGRFNVESAAELRIIDELAGAMGKIAHISLRVNPDIGAHTHANITTGLSENKFGINYEQLPQILELAESLHNVKYEGLHYHIGSQILDMGDFAALCNRSNQIVEKMERAGMNPGDLNMGGGLGINYQHPNHLDIADFESYFDTFRKFLKTSPGQIVHFELGRSIVAPCGSLISRVLYVKEGTTRKFAIIDGSMTELIRPALYNAYHRVENISSDEPEEVYDVVGPVCESSDVFAKGVSIDKCHRGDFIAIRSAGAYGEAMASCYNCHPLPPSFFNE